MEIKYYSILKVLVFMLMICYRYREMIIPENFSIETCLFPTNIKLLEHPKTKALI
jgi:hypothetical protein